MHMRAFTYTYANVCAYIHNHTYIHTHVHAYTRVGIHAYMYAVVAKNAIVVIM